MNPSCPDVSFLKYATGIKIRMKIDIQMIYFIKSFFCLLNLIKNTMDIGIIISTPSNLTVASNTTIPKAK